jgi:hypothetical protein
MGTSPFDGNAAGNDVFLLSGMNQSHPLGLQFCGAESIRYKQHAHRAEWRFNHPRSGITFRFSLF